MQTEFTRALGIQAPIIGGAMYPCSNPELVSAVSRVGGIGIIQPLSLTYVHGYDFRAGIRYMRHLTDRPLGVNLIIEASSRKYLRRVHEWLDIALEEGIGFFITALGNPRWVVERAKPAGALVYHDATNRRWADKALAGGVDGFICVNDRAGGHVGELPPEQLFEQLAPLGRPLICAGGIGSPADFRAALAMGYAGVQLGTRLIAARECNAHADYKARIIAATESDITLSEKISGVPVSVIRTPYIDAMGTRAGPLARWMLRHPRTKHWMRTLYSLQSLWRLKRSALGGSDYRDYYQAGRSVGGIHTEQTVAEIIAEFTASG